VRAAACVLLGAAVSALVACSGSPTGPPAWLAPTGEGRKDVASGSPLERFFPLVDGNVYHYVTENLSGEPGMLVARAVRTSADSGELRFPKGTKRFSFVKDGVVLELLAGPIYLLKEPVAVGTSWRGEHGGTTRILSTNASIDVPAGHYDGCVQTLEERGGDEPVRFATTYCPAVGVVLLEAGGGGAFERAALSSYGAPTPMKADGLERFQVTPTPEPPAPPPR
jgi:hypothetical protein